MRSEDLRNLEEIGKLSQKKEKVGKLKEKREITLTPVAVSSLLGKKLCYSCYRVENIWLKEIRSVSE